MSLTVTKANLCGFTSQSSTVTERNRENSLFDVFGDYPTLSASTGVRGSVVVKALCYKPKVAGSIPDEVIGFFQLT
jgi:hypothetical protein